MKVIKFKIKDMNINDLTKPELLKLKKDIESQLKFIDEVKGIKIPQYPEKTKLSDLEKGDKIFCISFNGSIIHNMDYVRIYFNKEKRKDHPEWISFATEHDTKPMGCSSSLLSECMYNHYFLSEFYSSMYFFTLKPETWKDDLKSEVLRLTKLKKEYSSKEIRAFKSKIRDLIKSKVSLHGR